MPKLNLLPIELRKNLKMQENQAFLNCDIQVSYMVKKLIPVLFHGLCSSVDWKIS